MHGSLYPDSVLVDRVALRRTELSKSEEILRNRLDWTSRGIYSGGAVTVNTSDNTKVDVAQLSGFVPNGEFVETNAAYVLQSLSSYTAGTINYVGMVYSETNNNYQPHETDTDTYATSAEMSWRLRIYTEAEYNALAATDDNLANDARDRFLLIAKVIANGSGVPLTASSISSPTAYNNLLYASPASPITGTNIIGVDPDMSTGVGTLDWDSTASTLTWTSYGGGAGGAVSITGDDNYTLLDGAGYYLIVQVVVSQLPAANDSDTTTIINLYYQEIPRQTAEDTLHRSKQGTGVLSPTNPHALSLTDISGEDLPQIEEHQDIMHCNGIWRSSSSGIFTPTLNTSAPSGDTLFIQLPVSGDLFYVNGAKLQEASPGSFLFTPANFTAGSFGPTVKEGAKLYEISVDDEGLITLNLRTDTNPTATPARTVTGVWIIDMSDEHPAGSYELKCNVSAGPIYSFTWGDGVDDGFPVIVTNNPPPTDPEGQVIRLYAPDGVNWIDLYLNRSTFGPNIDSRLPSGLGTYTDTITVRDHLVYEENMKVLHVVYWYNGTRGTIGWDTDLSGSGSRHTIDKRQWGTLCAENMADEGLKVADYDSTDELHFSGILFARNDWGGNFVTQYSGSGLSFPITGGSYYCRGKRLFVESSDLSISDSTSTLVYADSEGSLQVLDIGAATDFGDDLDAAMKWIMGSTFDRTITPDEIYVSDDEGDYSEKGVPLYYLVTSGGNITRWLDVSRNVNGPVDPWSVGTRRNDPYDSTADSYLAAFDSLEAAFLHVRVYQDTAKNLQSSIEIKLVGDSYIFAEASISQPADTIVTGASSLLSAVFVKKVTSYRDASAGAWLLNNGCQVRSVDLITDASVSATASFFGLANSLGVGGSSALNIIINGCSCYATGYFMDFGIGGTMSNLNIINNKIATTEGLIRDPSAVTGSISNVTINENDIYVAFTTGSKSAIDLRICSGGSGVEGAIVKDNLLRYDGDVDGLIGINTNDKCFGVEIENNIITMDPPNDPSYSSVIISADGITRVRGNFIRCDYSTGTIGSPPSLNTAVAVSVVANAESVTVRDNVILYAGIGIELLSISNRVVSDNIILDCYNRGVLASDTGGDATLSGLKITGNYITGLRDSAENASYIFDNFLRGIDIQFSIAVGSNSISNIVITDNIIPYMGSTCIGSLSNSSVYGIFFNLVGAGAGSSPPISGVSIDRNIVNDLGSTSSYNVYHIYLTCGDNLDLPLDTDPLCSGIKDVSICNNTISCRYSTIFYGAVGIKIYLNSVTAPINSSNINISNNEIGLWVSSDTPRVVGIEGAMASSRPINDVRVCNNSIISNEFGIDAEFQSSVVEGNNIISKRQGITLSGHSDVISRNTIVCITDCDVNDTVFGIIFSQISGTDYGADIIDNYIKLMGDQSTGVLACNVSTYTSNVWLSCSNGFTLARNITEQYYSSINGGYSASHLHVASGHGGFWSVDGNTVYNVNVKGSGTTSDSEGIYIDSSSVSDERGIVCNNNVFGSNSSITNPTSTVRELYIGSTSSIITTNNNTIMLIYTGPGTELVNTYIAPSVQSGYLNSLKDYYLAGGTYNGQTF